MLNEMIRTADSRNWGKSKKVEVFSGLLFGLEELEIHDTDTHTARKVTELESIAPYSAIGKDNYYCGNCKTRVKRKDNFCRNCGFEFEKGDDENVDQR